MPIEEAQWYRIDTALPNPSTAAVHYLRTLTSVAGDALEIDVALLGVGEDGHVASVFPGSGLDAEREKAIVVVNDSPKPPAVRLSMSLPLLAGARLTVVAAFGAAKRKVARTVLDPASQLPAARLLRDAGYPVLMLDAYAAADVPSPPAASGGPSLPPRSTAR
jgi:6-phosphogluconolactonase